MHDETTAEQASTRAAPKVSVGLPVHNGERFLERALESLLAQEFTDFEIVLVDNHSDDTTEAIGRRFAARDDRVRYFRNETNIGAARNFNRCFELSTGEYFRWAAHDDECHPAFLARCVEMLDQAPDTVVMVYPLGELIDEHGERLKAPLDRIACDAPSPHRRLAHVIRTLNMCDPIFGLYRASELRHTGLIGSFFGADNVLLGEMVLRGEYREIDEVLFSLRAHPGRSMTANRTVKARVSWFGPAVTTWVHRLPGWEQMVVELLRAVHRSELRPLDRTRCWAVIVIVHYKRRLRAFAGRWKRRVMGALQDRPTDSA